jgi:glycosyltransferase involved in cell wall biosynthesis
MKVLHVSPSFYPATYYGGPIYSTSALCNALVDLPNIELRVLTTDTAGPNRSRIRVDSVPSRLPQGYEVYYCRRWWGEDIAPGLFARLWSMIRWADVVHLTGVYSPPTVPTLFIAKMLNKAVVWSLHGALQSWPGSRHKQSKAVWTGACNLLCDSERVTLHVTSESEKEESSRLIGNAVVCVIPNGVDLPELEERSSSQSLKTWQLLYLGRLHPIKGIENLVRAVARNRDTVTLSIVGDGEADYVGSLRSLVSDLALDDRVKFHGHLTEEAKTREFINSDACVVSSFKESFCIVVAEALAHGVPVITSTGTPWQRVEEIGCGLWVDNSPDALSAAIRKLQAMPIKEMGKRGREWMQREFLWSAIGKRMATEYLRVMRLSVASNQEISNSQSA